MKIFNTEATTIEKSMGTMLVAAGIYTRIYSRQCFRSSNFDITPEQFVVIEALMNHDGLYQRQLGEITMKDRPNITRIINILQKNGYVERRSDVNKRKVFKIFLTQKARENFANLARVASDYRHTMISGITSDELELCMGVLNKILNNLLDKVDMNV